MGGSGQGSGSEIPRHPRSIPAELAALALAGSLGVPLTACAGYVPVTPRVASNHEARIGIVRMTRMLEITLLELRVERARAGTVLHEVLVARASSSPCRFGWAPLRRIVMREGRPPDDSDEPTLKPGDRLLVMYGAELAALD